MRFPTWIAALIAALMLAGAAYNAGRGDLANAGAGLAIAAVLGGVFVHERRAARGLAAFATWLAANAAAVRAGGADWRGVRITPETRVRQFTTCVSCVVLTYRVRSRWYVAGADPVLAYGLAHTLVTLACGWWGIPFGLLWTPGALLGNLKGGRSVVVGELLPSEEEMRIAALPPVWPD